MHQLFKIFLGYCLIQFFTPLNAADRLADGSVNNLDPYKLEVNHIYSGFGFSDHSSTIGDFEGDALGFSVFVGYILPIQPIDYARFSIEAGYLSTDNFDWKSDADGRSERSSADSALASGLIEVNVVGRWQLIGRAGYDFGDDVGTIFGFGVGYQFRNGLGIRTEYREQEKIETTQLNFTMRVKDFLF